MYEFVCERQRQKVLTSTSILPVSPEDIFVPLNVFFFFLHNSQCSRLGAGRKGRNQETTQEPSFQKGLGTRSAFCKWLFLAWVLSAVACQVPPAKLLVVSPVLCSQSKVSWFILILFNFRGLLHLGN